MSRFAIEIIWNLCGTLSLDFDWQNKRLFFTMFLIKFHSSALRSETKRSNNFCLVRWDRSTRKKFEIMLGDVIDMVRYSTTCHQSLFQNVGLRQKSVSNSYPKRWSVNYAFLSWAIWLSTFQVCKVSNAKEQVPATLSLSELILGVPKKRYMLRTSSSQDWNSKDKNLKR